MTEKERQQYEQRQQEHYSQLYENMRPQVEQGIIAGYKARQRRKKKLFTYLPVAAALVVVLCASIILPIVLTPSDIALIRYDGAELGSEELTGITLKDYAISQNESIKYLDWYDHIYSSRKTIRYFDKETKNTIYLSERITDMNTDYTVVISFMKNNYFVNSIEATWTGISSTYMSIKNTEIEYYANLTSINARFELDGYKYYLFFSDCSDMEFLTDTLNELLT